MKMTSYSLTTAINSTLADSYVRVSAWFEASGVVRLHPGLWLALLLGMAFKGVLLTTNSVTFDSDEAVIALMARHITQGARPVFFYGQNYMGALDAYLVALAFTLFGQQVVIIQVVQSVLYAFVIITTYSLSLHLSKSRPAATAGALLVALPPVLLAVYTISTLGNYVEILLLGNLLLLLGWRMGEAPDGGPFWHWGLWGLLAGIGWWSMSLIVVTATPVAIYVVARHVRRMPWGKFGIAALGAVVGAAPWIVATISNGPATTIGDLSGTGIESDLTSWPLRVLILVAFNLPALFGLRPPWAIEWIALPVGIPLAAVYLAALWAALRFSDESGKRYFRLTLLGSWGLLLVIFVATPFGRDPTGRYLLPLYPLLAILLLDWLARWRSARWLAVGLVGVILAFNLWGALRAVQNTPPGLSTQFNEITAIPHDSDDELLAFLESIGSRTAYTNYWVAFRFAFLTGEQLTFAPSLPYKHDLSYTSRDDRIPAYTQTVDADPNVTYITSKHPVLDELLVQRFREFGVEFKAEQIGPYRVFYDLSRPVRPGELEPFAVNTDVSDN